MGLSLMGQSFFFELIICLGNKGIVEWVSSVFRCFDNLSNRRLTDQRIRKKLLYS